MTRRRVRRAGADQRAHRAGLAGRARRRGALPRDVPGGAADARGRGRGAPAGVGRTAVRRLGAGTSLAVVVALATGGVAAAYSSKLPDPVQRAVHSVLSPLGVPEAESQRHVVEAEEPDARADARADTGRPRRRPRSPRRPGEAIDRAVPLGDGGAVAVEPRREPDGAVRDPDRHSVELDADPTRRRLRRRRRRRRRLRRRRRRRHRAVRRRRARRWCPSRRPSPSRRPVPAARSRPAARRSSRAR